MTWLSIGLRSRLQISLDEQISSVDSFGDGECGLGYIGEGYGEGTKGGGCFRRGGGGRGDGYGNGNGDGEFPK